MSEKWPFLVLRSKLCTYNLRNLILILVNKTSNIKDENQNHSVKISIPFLISLRYIAKTTFAKLLGNIRMKLVYVCSICQKIFLTTPECLCILEKHLREEHKSIRTVFFNKYKCSCSCRNCRYRHHRKNFGKKAGKQGGLANFLKRIFS